MSRHRSCLLYQLLFLFSRTLNTVINRLSNCRLSDMSINSLFKGASKAQSISSTLFQQPDLFTPLCYILPVRRISNDFRKLFATQF